jgi:transmembrane sensor
LSAAGIAGVLVTVGWLAVSHLQPAGLAKTNDYHTAVGERSAITLQDGSTVVLNTNSALEVDFTSSERRIRLLRGQAMFEVAKSASRTFVVFAGDRRITALGTAFDVRLDKDAVRVLLVEGRVAVDAASRARLELEPGEQLVAKSGAAAVVQPANIQRLTSWKSGRLIFQDESLGNAVAEVNRYIRHPLKIGDPRIAELRFSGVFRTAEVERFANSMTELYPIVANRGTDGSVSLNWRPGR